MQHSNNDTPNQPSIPLQEMVKLLEELLELRKQKKASIVVPISQKILQLQQLYAALDADAKSKINEVLRENNIALLSALEKKGIIIAQALALAEGITETLPAELQKIIGPKPAPAAMQTTAIPSFEPQDDAMNTTRVVQNTSGDDQLKAAVDHATHQMSARSYAMFSVDESVEFARDPLGAVIEALEILRRTQALKEKILGGMAKPAGYDNAYKETLIRQMKILSKCKRVLTNLASDKETQTMLTSITKHLQNVNVKDVPSTLIIAGKISVAINEQFITKLSELKASQSAVTPRPDSDK